MEKQQIRDLMLKNLRNSFALFSKSHKVNVHFLEGKVCIGYRTTAEILGKMHGTTYFDIETAGDLCRIDWIELEKVQRGKGLGWQLYETVHNFAREFGCISVRLTPSGWTPQGKTRRDYLLKRGYVPCGEKEVEFMLY